MTSSRLSGTLPFGPCVDGRTREGRGPCCGPWARQTGEGPIAAFRARAGYASSVPGADLRHLRIAFRAPRPPRNSVRTGRGHSVTRSQCKAQ
jgi:hypothetical protein